ncbi:MAG: SUMF1/EgtB/PvdO family nonheme iron enzyme [Phycisphaerae bacterium]|nr:SUMF1/EgtB/PvdO family nonheme iron enzyme [Phycisphaerae bacterium]
MKKVLWLEWFCLLCFAQGIWAECPSADRTGDCFVNPADLLHIAQQWMSEGPDCPSADINGDCRVDVEDFAMISRQWLSGDGIPNDMVLIPAGVFQMGDAFGEGGLKEQPLHMVSVNSFLIGIYEVTNTQYCDFLNDSWSSGQVEVRDGRYVYPVGGDEIFLMLKPTIAESSIHFDGHAFSIKSGKENHPIVLVSWFGAASFCNWKSRMQHLQECYNPSTWSCDFEARGYRLPTEAEWEYAARGGLEGRRYPWGDSIGALQVNYWLSGDPYETGSYPLTTPVGFYAGLPRFKTDYNWPGSQIIYNPADGINGYGLYDVAGNVWEWCNDWSLDTYYAQSSVDNPKGPSEGYYRVIRGGYWGSGLVGLRVSNRDDGSPDSVGIDVGFRIALSLN